MEKEIKNYSWEFNLIDKDEINAFCMPGGKIGVYEGMFKVVDNETELAVIMAHEVAHAIANHAGERVSQALIAQFGAITLAQAIGDRPKKTQKIAMAAYGLGSQVGVLLPYSRLHESEADRIGLILMAKAGYDPRASLDVWGKMKKQSKGVGIEFLSTHPVPDSRIAGIEQHLPEALKYYKP
jgi:predicted Zn-dependent protease